MDGVSFDLINPLVIQYQWKGLLIEPNPHMFEKLKENYKDNPNLSFSNSAIFDKDGSKTLYYYSEDTVKKFNSADWLKGLSSFYKPHLTKHVESMISDAKEKQDKDLIRRLENSRKILLNEMKSVEVPCYCFETLFKKEKIEKIDVLAIDTEGADYIIFKQLDLEKFSPYIILMEIQHLNENEINDVENTLSNKGYNVKKHNNDCDLLAIKPLD